MFEIRVLRRIFGPKRDEVTEEWRKLHNEERKVCTGFWWGRDHLGDAGIDERKILRWIFRKWDVGNGLDQGGSR